MTRLSVNINKIATLRNARGGNNPNVLKTALDCERFGAQGITVHPRPDERHIRKTDVYELHSFITTEFNIEGYPSEDFCNLVLDVCPTQVTLVPDTPDQLTSNSGWDTVHHQNFLKDIVSAFKEQGIRTSIFVEANPTMIENAKKTGCDRVELYTEPYATQYTQDKQMAITPFIKAAMVARENELGLNAGHDLNLSNLRFFHQQIPWIDEVSIGHALICDALYFGLKNTIYQYLEQLK